MYFCIWICVMASLSFPALWTSWRRRVWKMTLDEKLLVSWFWGVSFQKASDCDKGYGSWDIHSPHLVLRNRRRHSGKGNHWVWFVLLNNLKKTHKTPQTQHLLAVGITFALDPNKRGLIVFFWWEKKPSTQARFLLLWHTVTGQNCGGKKEVCIVPLSHFLCSGICFH